MLFTPVQSPKAVSDAYAIPYNALPYCNGATVKPAQVKNHLTSGQLDLYAGEA